MPTTVSSLMNLIVSRLSLSEGSRMKRLSCEGIGSNAFMVRNDPSRTSSSPSVKPKLGMNGNGCAGSTAIGVSTGKMWLRKCCSSQVSSASVS